MARSILPAFRVIGLIALGLVLAHQAIYLVRYGSIYGEALVHAGHGQAWSDTVTTVLVAAAILGAIALFRLYRLGLLAAALGHAAPGDAPRLGSLVRRWLRDTAIVAPAILVELTLQENLEHAAAGFSMPGIGILVSQEYPFAIAIVLAVALAVAFVSALLAWRRELLVARIAAALRAARPRPRPAVRPRLAWVELRHAAIVGHHIAGRAPPASIASA